ncbi:MAG: hypothetical protein BroJett011_18950 [Chloroflexota bacterium]|nr:MAG: hypothetical protein BroJett011_18950 [Chloroflexota bacterium]
MINLWRYFSLGARFRRVKRRLFGCCLLILFCFILACALLVGLSLYLAQIAAAQETAAAPNQVMLVIDNSNSMYEKNGQGSDPDLLRIEAARLFITYLGADDQLVHQLGVIFFGGESHLIAPFTPLADENRRMELARLIANPTRLKWTNQQAALELAEQTFQKAATTPGRRAVILLTDGKPEWSNQPTALEKMAIIAGLRETARRLVAQNIAVFVILLQNESTDADPEIETIYVPLWQELAAQTPPGRFYRARQSNELLDIYHDIVVTLTGRATAGIIVQTQVQTETVEPVTVEAGLAQITFVIRKSDPALQAEIISPGGQRLDSNGAGVQHAGQPGQSHEEIWAMSYPPAGTWYVRLSGQGTVTVWKDFLPAPATPTFTPSATATSLPTSSPTVTPTATLTPTPTVIPPTPTPTLTPQPTSTRAATPTSSPTPIPLKPASHTSLAWWVLLPVAVLAVGGGGWLWLQYHQPKLFLTGTLRPLAGEASYPARLDLDSLDRWEITLGAIPPADIHLPHTPDQLTPSARLTARLDADDQTGVVLTPLPGEASVAAVKVNNMAVSQEWFLRDGDVITLGGYRFKYENLRQRGNWKYEVRK